MAANSDTLKRPPVDASPLAPWDAVWLSSLGWQPTPEQLQAFQALYQAVLVGNRQVNLTRITEPPDFWEKHLWDSLRGVVSFWPSASAGTSPIAVSLPPTARVVDIGTGAGFPGLPIAIACPQWSMTLLDSTRKKLAFVASVRSALGLANVTPLVERVEAVGQRSDHREQYDLAVIRAVGPATVCAEYALPLVKVGGWAVLYRGEWTAIEAEALHQTSQQLGGSLVITERFHTPLSHSVRHLLYLRKDHPTPQPFPRGVGIPAQSPLA
ncbi:16S rRNA (guanine(527)-N(7))-methyltransferase RsmG [Trichothermofontia sp.]